MIFALILCDALGVPAAPFFFIIPKCVHLARPWSTGKGKFDISVRRTGWFTKNRAL